MYKKYLVIPMIALALISSGKAEGSKKLMEEVIKSSKFFRLTTKLTKSRKKIHWAYFTRYKHTKKDDVIWEGSRPTEQVPYKQKIVKFPKYKNYTWHPELGLASYDAPDRNKVSAKPRIEELPDNKGFRIHLKCDDDKSNEEGDQEGSPPAEGTTRTSLEELDESDELVIEQITTGLSKEIQKKVDEDYLETLKEFKTDEDYISHMKENCCRILVKYFPNSPVSSNLKNFLELLSSFEDEKVQKLFRYDKFFREQFNSSRAALVNTWMEDVLKSNISLSIDKQEKIYLVRKKIDHLMSKIVPRKINGVKLRRMCRNDTSSTQDIGSQLAELEKKEGLAKLTFFEQPKELIEKLKKIEEKVIQGSNSTKKLELFFSDIKTVTLSKVYEHMKRDCFPILKKLELDFAIHSLKAFMQETTKLDKEKVDVIKTKLALRFYRDELDTKSRNVSSSLRKILLLTGRKFNERELLQLMLVFYKIDYHTNLYCKKINYLMSEIVPGKIEEVQTQDNTPKKEAAPKFQYLCQQLFQEKTDWGIESLKFDPQQADQFNVYIEKLGAIEEKVIKINDNIEPFFSDSYDNPIKKFENLTLKDLAPHILKNCCPILKELGYPKTSEAYKDFINETYNLSGFSLRNDRNYRDRIDSVYTRFMQAWGKEILKSSPIAEDKLLQLVLVNQKMAFYRRVYAKTIHELIN